MRCFCENTSLFGVLLLLLLLTAACDSTRVYEEWEDIKGEMWALDSVYHFSFALEDTTMLYNLDLGIRNTNRYPYQNLWLLTSIHGPENFSYQDTILFALANKSGEWYGRKSAHLYTYVARLYRDLRFYTPGDYTFSVRHGMRKQELIGVSNVGLRLEMAK